MMQGPRSEREGGPRRVRVRVRVSRTLGDRVTGVAPYVLNLFLLTPYTQSNPKVYCVLKI